MIELVIFYVHLVAAAYAFTQRWQQRGMKDGILAVALMALVFVIGWSMTAPLANIILPNSWRSQLFSSDTLSLILLAIGEAFFFKLFFLKNDEEQAAETV